MTDDPHRYYDSFAEELEAKFRRVTHLVSNKAATGDYHEEILRVVLRNFLSRRFSVKTGFIYKSDAGASNQIDIMIVDEYEASAYVYQEGDFAIIRPQAVVAVLEVKTRLRATDFDEAIANIASAKKLTENPERICGMIFGYDGTNPSPNTLDKWFKRPAATALVETPRLGPTLISFFSHGLMLLRLNFDSGLVIDDSSNYHPVVHFTKAGGTVDEAVGEGWQLRHVLAMIYSSCASRELAKTRLIEKNDEVQELLQFSGAVPSGDHYQLGQGFIARISSSGEAS